MQMKKKRRRDRERGRERKAAKEILTRSVWIPWVNYVYLVHRFSRRRGLLAKEIFAFRFLHGFSVSSVKSNPSCRLRASALRARAYTRAIRIYYVKHDSGEKKSCTELIGANNQQRHGSEVFSKCYSPRVLFSGSRFRYS